MELSGYPTAKATKRPQSYHYDGVGQLDVFRGCELVTPTTPNLARCAYCGNAYSVADRLDRHRSGLRRATEATKERIEHLEARCPLYCGPSGNAVLDGPT